MSHFLEKLKKISPLRARKFEKVHYKGMIFHRNSLHRKGPILEAKFWAERMVVLRSSALSHLFLGIRVYFERSKE